MGKVSELALETADGMRTLRDHHSLTISSNAMTVPKHGFLLKIVSLGNYIVKSRVKRPQPLRKSLNETFHIVSRQETWGVHFETVKTDCVLIV